MPSNRHFFTLKNDLFSQSSALKLLRTESQKKNFFWQMKNGFFQFRHGL